MVLCIPITLVVPVVLVLMDVLFPFQSACEYYNLDPNLDNSKPLLEAHKWGKNKFRLRKVEQGSLKTSSVADLRNFHNRPNILKAVLKERTKLQSPISP